MYLSKKVDLLVVAFIRLDCDLKSEKIVLAIGEDWCYLCQVQFINIYYLHANKPICQISMLCWVMTVSAACNFKLDTTNTSWIQKLWNYKWNSTKKTPSKVTILLVHRSWKLIHNESNTKHQYISTYDDNIAFLLHVTNTCLLSRLENCIVIRLSPSIWMTPSAMRKTLISTMLYHITKTINWNPSKNFMKSQGGHKLTSWRLLVMNGVLLVWKSNMSCFNPWPEKINTTCK
jgi:hypothetical protein